MKLTSHLFADFLRCPTKCYLHSTGQAGTGNACAEWAREHDEAYKIEAGQRLMEAAPEAERFVTPPAVQSLKTATWRLALDLNVETGTMESRLHAVERVPPQGRGKPTQFSPVRFVFFNKLSKDHRLLVAFDALLLSQALGREVSMGKIIHGDDHATFKVKVTSLLGAVQKIIGKMAALLVSTTPPELVLNRHCVECEFRNRCREKATEKDDLSLLPGMTAKERGKYPRQGLIHFSATYLYNVGFENP